VASVLVHIEVDGDRPSRASLEALGEGRRIATTLGATLYAFAVFDEELAAVEGKRDALAKTLGSGGADKVIMLPRPNRPGPPGWGTHGRYLLEVCEEVRPVLVLLAGDALGRDIAPRLAAKLGAAFVAEPSIECGPRGEIVFSRSVYGATHRRRLAAEELGQAVVATLTPGAYKAAEGDDEAEIIFRRGDEAAEDEGGAFVEASDDPGAGLEAARIVVVAGAGIDSFDSYALLEELARALGGELGATSTLCDKGIAPAEREIGVGARRIAPELILLCAVSGSSATLGALSSDAEIVAINLDPQAPVFRVASYGIVGDVEQIVPELLAALRQKNKQAATS